MASHATKHFIRQRFTALLQVPLSIFLVVSIILQAGSSREEVMAWVSTWWVAALLIAWFVSVPMHMSIGIGDVIDDYRCGNVRPEFHSIRIESSAGPE